MTTARVTSIDGARRFPWRPIIAALVLGTALAALTLAEIAAPVRVRGRSMEPTLHHGDLVLVVKWRSRVERVAPGEVVLARAPPIDRGPSVLVVKRVAALGSSGGSTVVRLLGDAGDQSRDSRVFGDLPLSAVEGVVVARLAPWPVGTLDQPPQDGSRGALRPTGR